MLEKITHKLRNKTLSNLEERVWIQLQYAVLLSARKNHLFDTLIHNTEAQLMEKWSREGAITYSTVQWVEDQLMPLKEEAKQFEMLCVAHAHIDMNWQWGFDETVGITLDTCRTMLQIMKEYPEFTFSQSQGSVYHIVEQYDPEMLEEIKQRVAEGRWEVTASTWVEADKNMPSSESQVRQILYTKQYLSKLFNKPLEDFTIDFEPDTFGHSLHTPELLANGGVKYYYHCRGRKEGPTLYRWMSPSGSEVIVNWEPQFYNAFIKADMCLCVPDIADRTQIPSVLKVYGVGDHGGGPTRRDIEKIKEVATWPIYPKIKFSTYQEYFKQVESYKDKLPIETEEQNFICDGCYSSQSRIKKGNKQSENDLYTSELWSTWAALAKGHHYSSQGFEKAWRNVLFNQFHDILTGSCVDVARDHALGLYQEVAATTQTATKLALQKITQAIHTEHLVLADEEEGCLAYGSGAGSKQYENGMGKTRIYHVFNPTMKPRQEVVELMIWEWLYDKERMLFTDDQGKAINHQVLEADYNHYWGHNYLRVAIEVNVPALGYTTYVLSEADIEEVKVSYWHEKRIQKESNYILENDKVKVIFDTLDLSIISFIDKATGEEMIDSTRKSGIFRLIDEADHKDITDQGTGMSSWFTGRYKNIEDIHQNVEVTKKQGALRSELNYVINFRNSKMKVGVILDKGSSRLDFKVECDWQERGSLGKGVPQLQFYMPLKHQCTEYIYDIPFGVTSRMAQDMDLPGQNYIYGKVSAPATLMIMSKVAYGFRGVDNSMMHTLLRGSYDPDPCPEYGVNQLEFSLGVVTPQKHQQINEMMNNYMQPFTVVTGKRQAGDMPTTNTLMSIASKSTVVSSIKLAEADKKAMIIRVYELEGKEDRIELSFNREVKEVTMVDIHEQHSDLNHQVQVKENSINLEVKPHSLVTMKVHFD